MRMRVLTLVAAVGVSLAGEARALDVQTPMVTSYTTFKAQGATGTAAVDGVSMRSAARNTIYHCRFTAAESGYGFSWVSSSNVISFSGKPIVEGSNTWTSQVREVTSGSTRYLGGNGLPNHYTGTFPVSSSSEAGQAIYHPNPSSMGVSRRYAELPADPVYSSTPTCVSGEVGFLFTGGMLFDALDADGRAPAAPSREPRTYRESRRQIRWRGEAQHCPGQSFPGRCVMMAICVPKINASSTL